MPMADDSYHEELLKILETHGKKFLDTFSIPPATEQANLREPVKDVEFEDWKGFGEQDDGESYTSSDNSAVNISSVSNVILFADPTSKSSSFSTEKSKNMAFMSSKVAKLREDVSASRTSKREEDQEAELNDLQNDALLHRLVHTKLLSGSLNPDLNLSNAQRRRALEGRTMELAGKAKVGKGESFVRKAERNKAAKRVRLGIVAKQRDRSKKDLEEAKNIGNYYPTLKNLHDASSSEAGARSRKRERGLKMGIGRFKNGILKLSRDEISSVETSRGPNLGRQKKNKLKM